MDSQRQVNELFLAMITIKCWIKMIFFFLKNQETHISNHFPICLRHLEETIQEVYLHERMTSTMAPRSTRLTEAGIC